MQFLTDESEPCERRKYNRRRDKFSPLSLCLLAFLVLAVTIWFCDELMR